MAIDYIIVIALSYVVGSIPSGLILGKLVWHTDLRRYGSGNIGATNAWRTLGKVPGLLIFAADLLKGMFGVWAGMAFVGTPMGMVAGGLMAVVGHSASVFLRFKGGKGVATGLGVLVMMMPSVSAVVFAVWLVVVLISKYVSLGSIVAAALVPIAAYILGMPAEFIGFGLLAAVFVIYRHKSNISRLLSGTESKIKSGGR